MSKPVLRVRSLSFPRGSVADGLGSIPVRASRFGPVPAVDWFRDETHLCSGAVAFPVGLGGQATLPLRAEFEVLESFAVPLFLRSVPRGPNLLGRVFSIRMGPAAQGATLAMDLALEGHELAAAAVAQHELVWTWQHSRDSLDWRDFDETAHTVFTLLDHPAPPWGGPSDPHTVVPWLETMKTACRWARGVRDPKTAMDCITTSVDALGGQQIGDDILDYNAFASVTTIETFDITRFMKAVNVEPGAPHSMNCRDLATAIAVFAAQLGCRSSALRLEPKKGDLSDVIRTNPILLFGECEETIEPFSYHEVAHLGEERVVWDACLALDFDDQPETPPNEFRLPTGVELDGDQEPGGIGYVARLLVPSDRDCRITIPACDGIRYPHDVPPGACAAPDPIEGARRRLFFEELRDAPWSEPTAAALGGGFQAWLESVALDHAFGRSVSSGSRFFTFLPIRLQNGEDMAGVKVSVLRPPTRHRAIDIFLDLLTSYARTLRRIPKLGDFAMYGERDDTIVMLRGGVIAVIQGDRAGGAAAAAPPPARAGPRPALTAARALDHRLSDYFGGSTSST
jgi:hypothetical protein